MSNNKEPEQTDSKETKEPDYHDEDRVITHLGDVPVTNGFIDELGRGKGK
jgi:hypothetical protein